MLEAIQVCFTCLRLGNEELIDINETDSDNRSFLYKLETVLSSKLEEVALTKICKYCITKLAVSFEFKRMVLKSQETWGKSSRREEFVLEKDANDNKQELANSLSFESPQKLIPEEICKELATSDVPAPSESIKNEFMCLNCNVPIDDVNSHHFCTFEQNESLDEILSNSRSLNFNIVVNEVIPKKCKPKRNCKQKYACYKCDAKFEECILLKIHLSDMHNLEKFQCGLCNKIFQHILRFQRHIKSQACKLDRPKKRIIKPQTHQSKYNCFDCCKQFKSSSSMNRHLKAHSRELGNKTKKTPFLCTVCGKSFPYSNSVQRHMRVHTGIRNHECSFCFKKFKQSTHLQVHMRTHTGEKPYICDVCGESFALNATLQRHLSLHNKIKNEFLTIV